jgi:hypothetical protein
MRQVSLPTRLRWLSYGTLGVLWIFLSTAAALILFFQNSTQYRDASFNEENGHKLWTGCIKIPSITGGLLGKNRPSLTTYSHLNIILKIAKIQLNSSHVKVKYIAGSKNESHM